jgi:serine/threonine-protein kinase
MMNGDAEDPASAPTRAAPTEAAVRAIASEQGPLPDRYVAGEMLGRGGMGEVRRFADVRIGRDVAVKVMRVGSSDEAHERFLREARLQGQLEHPAIVPVYDVGEAEDGSPYFTMKQLRGMTLATVLERIAAGDEAVLARFGRRRLLGDFTRAAQAVAYAHSKGVVHRDLKPGNIMFGDFGEVYVLDWGIARVRGVAEAGGSHVALRIGESSQTRDGSVLGTLGYMPPEQLDAPEQVDRRADVYALGAVLFEVLAGQKLHVGADVPALIQATTRGSEGRPSVRAPDRTIPPELDDVCAKATAQRPDDRYPDVESMVTAVDRYLDGDRDLARRRKLAHEHAERARHRLQEGGHDNEARALAMREAGQAIALDPGHPAAAELLSRLLLEPPSTIPREVDERIAEEDDQHAIIQARIGALSGAGWLLLVPVLAWMGVRSWGLVAVFVLAMVALQILSWKVVLTRRPTPAALRTTSVVVGLVIAWSSLIFGPLVLTPALAAMTVGMFMLEPDRGEHRWFLAGGVAVVVVPWALEQLGLLAPSMTIAGDALVLHPRVADFEPIATTLMLLGSSVAAILVIGRTVATMTSALRTTRRRLALHAWHLDQLLPRA